MSFYIGKEKVAPVIIKEKIIENNNNDNDENNNDDSALLVPSIYLQPIAPELDTQYGLFRMLIGGHKVSNMTNFSSDCNLAVHQVHDVSFPNVTEIGTIEYAFQDCTKLATVNFPKLTTITNPNGFNNAFNSSGVKSICFSSLTEEGLSGEDIFYEMLSDVDKCTVHFPTNLETYIGTLETAMNGFGGINTQILFDL